MSAEGSRTVEERLAALEDARAISDLIATYGPLVDSGDAEAVAALWEPDGIYDIDETRLEGHAAIEAMVRSRGHQGLIAAGCAHLLGPPRVTVDGDEAVAVCQSLLVAHGEKGFRVLRATANHWHLRRGPAGWRVRVRTGRVLDGRTEAPYLLAEGAHGRRVDET